MSGTNALVLTTSECYPLGSFSLGSYLPLLVVHTQAREPRGGTCFRGLLTIRDCIISLPSWVPEDGIFPALISYNLDQEKQETLVMGRQQGNWG